MTHYRFYLLDADNKITKGEDTACINDTAAYLDAMSRLEDDTYAEIWSGTRYVGQVRRIS